MGDTESGHCQQEVSKELVVLSGSFMSHSKSARTASPFLLGRASHERYTVSNVEGREINLHRPIPSAPGIQPGAAA